MEDFKSGTNYPLCGASKMALLVASSPAARDCAVTQYYRYTRGYVEGERDDCVIEELTQAFRDSQLDLKQMLINQIEHPSFMRRHAGGES